MTLISRVSFPALLAVVLTLSGCLNMWPVAEKSASTGTSSATVQTVSFHLAQSEPEPGLTAVSVPGGTLYIDDQALLTRSDLTDATAMVGRFGEPYVGLRFTQAGAQKLAVASRAHKGDMLALIIGRELVSAPRMNASLEHGVLAFAAASAEAADELAARIRGDAVQ